MIIIELVLKLALLIAVSVLSGFISKRWERNNNYGIILQGSLFGLVAVIGMLNPFVLAPGIIFDGRSVVLSLCALFFGPLAGLIAIVFPLAYRIYLGGGGEIMGVSVIFSSYIIGSVYYSKNQKKGKSLKTYELYFFGLLVHFTMMALMLAIPSSMRIITFKTISLTIIGIYPLATVLIGKILNDQKNNQALLAELEASEKQFRSLVNNMNQGLAVHKIIFDTKGQPVDYRFEYINEKYEHITGLKKENVLGKTILEVLPKTSEKTILKYAEVAITGIPFHFESYSREQNMFFEADIYQPSKNHFAVIISDITSRKLAQREIITKNKSLAKLNSEKDKLFSIVSHDLRSPMNGILGLTGLIIEETDSFSKDHIKDIASSIHTSANSILQLLGGLLEWSHLQRENVSFDPQTLILTDSVHKCIDLLNESAKAKKITIRTNIPDNLSVYADAQMLDSIIRNLLSNAIKFTPKAGLITVNAVESEDHKITVSISDNGIGMSPDIVNQLFSLSAKINRKGTEGEVSSGLGLILCKELIEKHNGRIWAESIENKGSTFYFSLTSPDNWM